MSVFVMLTRLAASSIKSPKSLEELEHSVMERIRSECPKVEWVHNLAVLGPYDYIDIFHAPDTETAFKVATLVRSFGHAHTEIWEGIEWARFKEMVRNLPGA